LLAAPLLALTAWVAHGLVARSHSHRAPASDERSAPRPGLPPPRLDLPAARLEEQVNGAADALRAEGCRRLLHWRFEDPPADAEALVFDTVEGARQVMDREAGPDRTPGPGDEAQVAEQSIYFRRGPVFVRLFLDPGAGPPGLAERAAAIDQALASGGLP
jgi:hypothetical protein